MTLITPDYQKQLRQKHIKSPWGGDGWRWIPHVVRMIIKCKLRGNPTVLDYGCGRHTFKDTMKWAVPHVRVSEYDPGVAGFDSEPTNKSDIVLCTDVMEHVERQFVDQTLKRLHDLSEHVTVINISCIPSKSLLPDGRNAHITVENSDWWLAKIEPLWAQVDTIETGKCCTVYAFK